MEQSPDKEQMLQRLRRIEGQLRGVQNMIQEERGCAEILQQLASIRSATQGATLVFVESYMRTCLNERPLENSAEREELVRDLMVLLGKTPV